MDSRKSTPRAQEITHKQHLLSKRLLREFARPGPAGELSSFNLRVGSSKLKHPAAVGWARDFISHAPVAAEHLWQTVETSLGGALDAVQAGTVLSNPAQVETLKQTIALHYFRRQLTRSLFDDSLERNLERRALACRRGSGVGSVDPELVAEAVRAEAGRQSPEWFQERVETWFQDSLGLIKKAGLEVLHASEGEFILGDSGVLSIRSDGAICVLPFAVAATHILPLGRQHAIAIAPTNAEWEIDQHVVDQLNRSQILNARSHVFFHPDSDLEAFTQSVRDEEHHLP